MRKKTEMLININHHLYCLDYCNRFLTDLPTSTLQSVLRHSRQNDCLTCHSSAQNLSVASQNKSQPTTTPCSTKFLRLVASQSSPYSRRSLLPPVSFTDLLTYILLSPPLSAHHAGYFLFRNVLPSIISMAPSFTCFSQKSPS